MLELTRIYGNGAGTVTKCGKAGTTIMVDVRNEDIELDSEISPSTLVSSSGPSESEEAIQPATQEDVSLGPWRAQSS
jgi:hypothetical protein